MLVVTTAGAPGKNLAAGAPNAHGATHAGAYNAAANAANGGASRARIGWAERRRERLLCLRARGA